MGFGKVAITTYAMVLLVGFTRPALGGTPLTTELVVSGLSSPVYVTHAPGDFARIFIVEQSGRIKVHELGTPNIAVFLDITGRVGFVGEKGLLGLAFHPDYAKNGFFYVNYTRPGDASFDTRISRFEVIGDPLTSFSADANSELILLTYLQPFPNHNAGWISFGPKDGFLYIASGDGGFKGDPFDNGQDITQLLGKILRIDVDGGVPFAIPPSNPFVGIPGADEIWSYGLRNPWRNAFDRLTGDLYIADVGQETWEEVNFQRAGSPGGENWGWRCREGAHDFDFDKNCASETLIDPIHEYMHSGNPFRCSITGGEVYRGCAIPDLQGAYFFADFCSNEIWSFRGSAGNLQEHSQELDPPGPLNIGFISSFGLDAYGEIYICDLKDGEVFKIVPIGGPFVDCNENGIEDACEFADGTSIDADRNGIPDEVGCNDSNVCTFDECAPGMLCTNTANAYADVNHSGGVDLFDLFCILNGFSGVFVDCTFHDNDIEPCPGDGDIDLFDLFAVLNAFSGDDPCCGG